MKKFITILLVLVILVSFITLGGNGGTWFNGCVLSFNVGYVDEVRPKSKL